MEKKKIIENVILFIVLLLLIIAAILLYIKTPKDKLSWREKNKIKNETESEVNLTKIGYGSEIESKGYHEAAGILDDFVSGYNTQDGTKIVAVMDLVSSYIFKNEADSKVSQFDEKYEQVLSNPDGYDKIVMLVASVKVQEQNLIDSINNTNVKISVEEHSEIEDITKYVSKMTAKIKTVSLAEEGEYTNVLEFLLLREDDAYYIFDYYAIDENGNKLE